MELISVSEEHVRQMMSWFDDKDLLYSWAGPGFRYPFTYESFIEDLNLDALISFSLVNDTSEFVGFGQCYRRNGKCHLGRIVIAPHFRGQTCQIAQSKMMKVSHYLISALSEQGCEVLEIPFVSGSVSLFVLNHNLPALNLYLSLGFVESQYPEAISIDNCLYMVK
ncbi:GNAT family N-acetyltransferase [Shewanella woodyi]|uniref:GNAT family N-acetyltransferase n=1 Tax=Shewanella woodyi TaxID=60961 RepID=UPI0007EB51B9|nr:GNAT family N-acetyltransferase [Shewanella woodyi]